MNIVDLFTKYSKAKPCQDHRVLEAGDIFVAIKGSTFDAHSVMNEVVLKKPAAIVLQDSAALNKLEFKGERIVVQNSRAAMDQLCHAYYGFPSQKLFCVGITGTNGKTTTSHLIEYALNQFDVGTGVIGTIDHHYHDKKWPTNLTTPGSLEFYSRLKDFVDLGAKALSVEVSSHAIDQDRMSSCQFDVAVFTNLTRDHLDYHGDMETYFKAKEKLFAELLKNSPKKSKYAVINQDDSYGRQISIPKNVQKISYGAMGSLSQGVDLTFEVLEQSFAGQKLNINYKGKKYPSQIQLSGHFNVLNYMATLGVLIAKQIPIEKAIEVFTSFTGVRGRLEKVPNYKDIHVFVDYAHTPDALENVLKTLGEIKNGKKIITVFGCGGDRDKGKRPLMGEIACRMSDHCVITSDNPRTEDPSQILKDIEVGCGDYKNYEIEVDRKKAIEKALNIAKNGDAVLIAGKGHEDYQIIGKTKHHFDDVEVAKNYLR